MVAMLGRTRRTTGTDVGLAIAFAGLAYLAWMLAAGVACHVAGLLQGHAGVVDGQGDVFRWGLTVWGVGIDLLGLLWLLGNLMLVMAASRQRRSISWAWATAGGQVLAAVLLACWTAFLGSRLLAGQTIAGPPLQPGGWTLFSVSIAIALATWVTVLVVLLYDRVRLGRGPSLRDGQRTHLR